MTKRFGVRSRIRVLEAWVKLYGVGRREHLALEERVAELEEWKARQSAAARRS